jgi:hypothetical protein
MFFLSNINFLINHNFAKLTLATLTILGLTIHEGRAALAGSSSRSNRGGSALITKDTSIDSLSDSKIIQYEFPQKRVGTIELLPGLGTNINFDPVNQIIQTIFLDNQSHLSMNTNGCLASEGKCPENSPIPTLIHLSLIDDIELPGVIHVNKQAAHNSLLTVVTVDSQKRRHTYLFALKLLNKSSGRKHIALVQIVPAEVKLAVKPVAANLDPEIAPKRPEDLSTAAFMNAGSIPFIPNNLRATDRQNILYLTDGFRLAVSRGDYKFNFIEYRNLNGFIKAVSTGAKLDSAPYYGLRLDVISNLVTLGTPTAPRDLPPTPGAEAAPTITVPPTTTQKPSTNEQEVSRSTD